MQAIYEESINRQGGHIRRGLLYMRQVTGYIKYLYISICTHRAVFSNTHKDAHTQTHTDTHRHTQTHPHTHTHTTHTHHTHTPQTHTPHTHTHTHTIHMVISAFGVLVNMFRLPDIYIYIYIHTYIIYMYISRNMNSFFINDVHIGCQIKKD